MAETTQKISDIIPVEAIHERDTDLLILEELKCNNRFRNWFVEMTIGSLDSYEFLGAWHSLTQVSLGESDLAFEIKENNRRILFLIENKIDASFQPDQAERYIKRGLKRKEEGHCDQFYTVLLAPQKYIIRNGTFNHYIEYEEIKSWFLNESELGDRAYYKADILSIAIEKLRRGYNPIPDEAVTIFWWAYFKYANKNYPYLKMRKPPVTVPKSSNFIMFEPTDIGLNKGDQILHKGNGSVDIQLLGKANELQLLIDKYGKTLQAEMKIVRASKSAVIRITVDKFDQTKNFYEQLDIIKNALNKVDKLYQWAKTNLKVNS